MGTPGPRQETNIACIRLPTVVQLISSDFCRAPAPSLAASNWSTDTSVSTPQVSALPADALLSHKHADRLCPPGGCGLPLRPSRISKSSLTGSSDFNVGVSSMSLPSPLTPFQAPVSTPSG